MNKRAPIYRICCLTRNKLLKSDLFRIVKKDNQVYFDKYQNMEGRGAYLSKNLQVIVKAQKKNALSKALKVKVDDEIYIELIQELNKQGR